MSILEKPSQFSSSSIAPQDVDPLLKDLDEKKLNFRRNVLSLAAELKEVRGRLASKEQSYAKESQTRLEVELKAKQMEVKIGILQKELEDKNEKLQASISSTVKDLKELDDLRTQLSATKASADASAASAQSAQLLCFELQKELDEKNSSMRKHEGCIIRLVEQVNNLQKDLLARESSQKQIKDEVLRIQHDIMEALAKATVNKDFTLTTILDEISPKNFEKMKKILVVKDEEISKLNDDIVVTSSHWELKTKELESQLEKQRHKDQELKKRVLKLEFCLQEARSQTRKLQRMGDRKDKAIKELRDQLATKQQSRVERAEKQNNFWGTSGFKIVISMSMLILMIFSKR
ncbi:nuclear envelope-associated protein 2-like [Abrus precatorius]|uniref:Nuclear envelope-associated protein 2-like n=1 Tax=Abrus precatorius TaxID=3816 RepID=A0A8B8LA83_ABRPR|nr:nuclear envelope-associated protein 2-like [Abrus precatorius]